MEETEPQKIAEEADARLTAQTATFVNNMQLPIHRWFRFPAGFSAAWAKGVIVKSRNARLFTVFDPFVGCGTTVLAGEECNVNAIGIDAHPFLVRIAKAKLHWGLQVDAFEKLAVQILDGARSLPDAEVSYPKLIQKCYSKDTLQQLDKLKRAWIGLKDDSPASELTWLALVCILRPTSHVGTAPWQYVLPRKKKKRVSQPFEAYLKQVKMMATDVKYYQSSFVQCPVGQIYLDDARKCSEIEDNSIDLVITSPPYTNNYDYADATRLEMSFFGEVSRWSDLHDKVRCKLIRSCSQHMSGDDDLNVILSDGNLIPIIDELKGKCHNLKEAKEHHGGRKRYDLMIAAYFSDLAKVWIALRRVCKPEAKVCFVVGDSGPYGIYIPVDKWLGELAVAAGFKSYRFEKIRDRNIKWNINRKHKILLHEGRLWVEG